MSGSHPLTSTPPLCGLRVVALEQAVAAPLCTRHLVDLGADVVKIERPGGGDFARGYDSIVHGDSAYFVWLNRGKRSVVLDLASDAGLAALEGLLARADVVVHNLGPGGIERLGLGWDHLHARWPWLIACGITAYGTSGPQAQRKGFDLLIQGEAGVVSVTGSPSEPAKVGISIADISSGMYALSAVLAALLQRHRTGEGIRIDIAMLDCLAEWMMTPLYHRMYTGQEPVRTGMRHNSICPYGPYPVAGGRMVNLAVHTAAQWQAFCTGLLEDPGLVQDPRYRTNELRVTNRVSLERLVEERLATRDLPTVLRALDAGDIPYGVVNDVAGLAAHVQLASRDRWFDVSTPTGPVPALRPPFNLAGVDMPTGNVPALGEHTNEVLAELGGNRIARATFGRSVDPVSSSIGSRGMWFDEAEQFRDIRSAVAQLCAGFPASYWRGLEPDEYPEAFVAEVTRQGWLAVLIPSEFGGAGLGLSAAGVILEEINSSGGNAAACHAQMYTMGTLLRFGSEAQKSRWLPQIAAGALRLQAFGITEPTSGSDTTAITTTAERIDGGWRINGQKVFISRAQHSDLMMLIARTSQNTSGIRSQEGLSVFLIDMRLAGEQLTIRPLKTMSNHLTTEVFFDGLEVGEDALVGDEGLGFRYLIESMNAERVLIASECIGDGRWFVRTGSAYSTQREVFGRPIGANQGVQFPLSRAHAAIEAASLMRWKAASLFDARRPCGPEANMAKLLSSEASWQAANACLDAHGGWGFAADYDVERKFRETRLYLNAPVPNNLVLAYLGHNVLDMPRSY
jgi:acyl-CoA dehydrogenase